MNAVPPDKIELLRQLGLSEEMLTALIQLPVIDADDIPALTFLLDIDQSAIQDVAEIRLTLSESA